MRKRLYWKAFLFAAAFAMLFVFCGCSVREMGTLPELSKPYLGMYECKELRLGKKDLSGQFDSVRLELKYGGEFKLSYCGKDGNKGGYSGRYEAEPEGEEITFYAKTGLRTAKYTFPMKNGKIIVDYGFAGTLLHAVFSSP